MIFRKYIAVFTFLFLVSLIGCKKENAFDCLKSNGEVTTVYRDVGKFRHVIIYDKIDLNIKQGAEYLVEINAGSNLLRSISTKNENGVLSINNNNKCNFMRGYKKNITITITVPKIDRVENQGVGTIRFDEGIVQDSIFLLAENSGDTYLNGKYKRIKTGSHGNGDIYASGSCDTLTVYTYGTNAFRGQNLTVNNYLFIETISIADCQINAPENGFLGCNIWRSGNVYYNGNPSTITNYSDPDAKGKLIKK